MFKKQFKVKNNCQLKSTEKKKLSANILQTFPVLNKETLLKSFPAKDCINQMKILTHQGDVVTVYLSEGRPMIIVLPDDRIIPTLYFLWIHPNITKYFTVTKFVLDKISKGADLMVPGIIVNEGMEETVYCKVRKGAAIAINIVENYAAHAVGISLMDTELLLKSDGRGKAVNIIHSYGDYLFKLSNEKIDMPSLSLTDIEYNPNENNLSDNNLLVQNVETELESLSLVDEITEEQVKKTEEISDESQTIEVQSMDEQNSDLPIKEELSPDEILKSSFLRGIISSRNKITFPILTNIFYKNYILNSVPSGVNFDIKKTSYKKLSLFLNEMEKNGVIVLTTSKTNVQSITDINYRHIMVSKFNSSSDEVTIPSASTETSKPNVDIIENYVVNSQTGLFFTKFGYQKGDIVPLDVIKKSLRSYVESENLLRTVGNQTVLVIDPILSTVTGFRQDTLPYSVVILKLLENMGNHYVIKRDGEITKEGRGKIPNIEISVKIRTSNKKVTIITNLDVFGINLNDLSRVCQHSLAASATIHKSSSKNDFQLQIQGTHVKYIKRLLKDKYGVPERFITDK